ncbi:hypothetical protein [Nonomuraea sp. NPDC049400]|uniref:hypothetical protein n=1 Tax=Nonomuraea sp. NPDC049400 TaxID=3364352 RepID=UPI0037974D69
MIRRILAGAAIAAAALGFSATAASADVGPNPQTSGWSLLSQLTAAEDLTALNNILNDSAKDIHLLPVTAPVTVPVSDVADLDAPVLSVPVMSHVSPVDND